MLRLQTEEPKVVFVQHRGLPVLLVYSQAPWLRRPHLLCQVSESFDTLTAQIAKNGQVEGKRAQTYGTGRKQASIRILRAKRDDQGRKTRP